MISIDINSYLLISWVMQLNLHQMELLKSNLVMKTKIKLKLKSLTMGQVLKKKSKNK